MARMRCSECGVEIPNTVWSCPNCGSPAEEKRVGNEISTRGMLVLLLLFVGVPVLLFLIQILILE